MWYVFLLKNQLIHTGEKPSQCDKWHLPSLPANVCNELPKLSKYCFTGINPLIAIIMISFPSQKPYYIKCIYMDARDTPFTLITLIAKSCITLSIYCLTFLWKAFKLTSLCSVSLIYFYELYHQLIHTGEKPSQCDNWL